MNWEPWTGCQPYSEGCENCYFYGQNSKRFGQNIVIRTGQFTKPLDKKQNGEYKIPGGKTVATCFATDFFIDQADDWRAEVWSIIKQRPDLNFLILTKRIDRFKNSLPDDWGDGYDNVYLGCTVENQAEADYRLPIFAALPIKRRFIACSPLLGHIDLSPYLEGGKIEHVTACGEMGRMARLCDYNWILSLRNQCQEASTTFWFKATGSLFKKDGQTTKINPYKQSSFAKELGINISNGKPFY